MSNASGLRIDMSVESKNAWNYILQKGFRIEGLSGMTIRQFLVNSLGFDDGFVDESVRTIFLNSSPIDNVDTTCIHDGDTLALGSAMPGLVGICMGRDNPYKEFRRDIACHADIAEDSNPVQANVLVKIFSTLAVECGENVLARGIELDIDQLTAFLNERRHWVNQLDVFEKIKNSPGCVIRIQVYLRSDQNSN